MAHPLASVTVPPAGTPAPEPPSALEALADATATRVKGLGTTAGTRLTTSLSDRDVPDNPARPPYQSRAQWPAIMHQLAAGQFPAHIRRAIGFTPRQWYYCVHHPDFKVALSELQADVRDGVVEALSTDDATLQSRLSRMRDGALDILEENLGDNDIDVRSRAADRVIKVTLGDKTAVELKGRMGVTIDPATAANINAALTDLNEPPPDPLPEAPAPPPEPQEPTASAD